jgi:hypothetical protein
MGAPVITYRGSGPWGPGYGSDLSANQFDTNNWNIFNSFGELFGAGAAKQISYIAESNGSLFVHYTDHSIDGPFPIPVASFVWRGTWTPSTGYNVNDTIYYRGGIYLALMNFTSGSSFSTTSGTDTLMVLMLRIPPILSQDITGTTYTPTLDDANTYMRATNTAGCNFTIAPQSSVSWAVQLTEMHFRDVSSVGTGGVTLTAGSGVTINPVSGRVNRTAFPGGVLFLKNVGTDSWDIGGLQAIV